MHQGVHLSFYDYYFYYILPKINSKSHSLNFICYAIYIPDIIFIPHNITNSNPQTKNKQKNNKNVTKTKRILEY